MVLLRTLSRTSTRVGSLAGASRSLAYGSYTPPFSSSLQHLDSSSSSALQVLRSFSGCPRSYRGRPDINGSLGLPILGNVGMRLICVKPKDEHALPSSVFFRNFEHSGDPEDPERKGFPRLGNFPRPGNPNVPQMEGFPRLGNSPRTGVPNVPQMEGFPRLGNSPRTGVPNVPQMEGFPRLGNSPRTGVPNVPQMEGFPRLGNSPRTGVPNVPQMEGFPRLGNFPRTGVPNVPQMEGFPRLGNSPRTGYPVPEMEGSSRNGIFENSGDPKMDETEGRSRPMDYVRGLFKDERKPRVNNGPQFSRYNVEQNADTVHIKILKNNTFVTLTDSKGNKKAGSNVSISAGALPDKAGKNSRLGAEASAEHVGRKARDIGVKSVVVKVNGYTMFKKKRQAIMSFREGFNQSRGNQNPVVYVEDTTRRPHNGCRLKKQRRI